MKAEPPNPITTASGANRAEGDVDLQVFNRFFLGSKEKRVMIDVGAAKPNYLSVSASFRRRGWRVIAIEPNPEFVKMHQELGHEVYAYACGDHDEDNVSFSLVDSHDADYEGGKVSFESFSSLAIKETYAALNPDIDVKKIKVNLRKLDTILATHASDVSAIDVLNIDVEGWELEVLRGLNFKKYMPKVLIVENLFDDPAYVMTLKAHGYIRWTKNHLNDVYVRKGFRGWGFRSYWITHFEWIISMKTKLKGRIQKIWQ